MKVWAITSARDEADIIVQALQHMVSEDVDGILMANNLSVDGTGELAREFAKKAPIPIEVIEDTDPAWDQARKMTGYAHMAAARGADWIVPFDMDELLCGVEMPLAEYLRRCREEILEVPSWTHVQTDIDPKEGNAFQRLRWHRPYASSLPKVCYRFKGHLKLWHGNDSIVDLKNQTVRGTRTEAIKLHHFPMRTFEHFCAKNKTGAIALAAAHNVPRNIGSHWRHLGEVLERQGVEAMREIYNTDWFYATPAMGGLVEDPAPWCKYAH